MDRSLDQHPEVERMSQKEGLRANSFQFTLEGEPFHILGGSIHYFRVPRAYWEDRLLKMRACGVNTLTTYVPWNLHEQKRVVLKAYISIAAELGLWFILRAGPYICAEWDLGGMPSWLLCDPDMKLRTTYPDFTEAVDCFDQLIPRVAPYQFSKGGPIIAVQVENEYGSYAKDVEYMPYIKEPQKFKMVMEYWSGWFDLWGDLHHVFAAEDYDAPLSEAGDYTTKYTLLRNVLSRYHTLEVRNQSTWRTPMTTLYMRPPSAVETF
ncbi:beta-galactosidase-1-like protein 2 isoform X2 [Oncorhynchus nerka]|uniref:beta-galactosidase-1-like protein 2 isoform X2 n=1 Tax=Oncorhynchus nerka TaxID=8023 RepID=UPI001131D714|nr:beta-galactosidase-1-like protein 2 isoform X2 [Oncorhynchus nerka]